MYIIHLLLTVCGVCMICADLPIAVAEIRLPGSQSDSLKLHLQLKNWIWNQPSKNMRVCAVSLHGIVADPGSVSPDLEPTLKKRKQYLDPILKKKNWVWIQNGEFVQSCYTEY